MTKLHHACQKINLTPHELHRLIHADNDLHNKIISISKEITPAATSLTKAIIVLGANTIKNMALETVATT